MRWGEQVSTPGKGITATREHGLLTKGKIILHSPCMSAVVDRLKIACHFGHPELSCSSWRNGFGPAVAGSTYYLGNSSVLRLQSGLGNLLCWAQDKPALSMEEKLEMRLQDPWRCRLSASKPWHGLEQWLCIRKCIMVVWRAHWLAGDFYFCPRHKGQVIKDCVFHERDSVIKRARGEVLCCM